MIMGILVAIGRLAEFCFQLLCHRLGEPAAAADIEGFGLGKVGEAALSKTMGQIRIALGGDFIELLGLHGFAGDAFGAARFLCGFKTPV
jgi:hypothetical protein